MTNFFIRCSAKQQEEILQKKTSKNVALNFADNFNDLLFAEDDVVFDLLYENDNSLSAINHPVFVNAVINTNEDLPSNFIRINAWAGFLQREQIEVATSTHNEYVHFVFEKAEWKYMIVPNEPGMISARIIAMIINEAFFALEDNVSTKEEIDIAMKLGTNYPFGPFEWSEKIGLDKINLLLSKLAEKDKRYTPATLLKNTSVNL